MPALVRREGDKVHLTHPNVTPSNHAHCNLSHPNLTRRITTSLGSKWGGSSFPSIHSRLNHFNRCVVSCESGNLGPPPRDSGESGASRVRKTRGDINVGESRDGSGEPINPCKQDSPEQLTQPHSTLSQPPQSVHLSAQRRTPQRATVDVTELGSSEVTEFGSSEVSKLRDEGDKGCCQWSGGKLRIRQTNGDGGKGEWCETDNERQRELGSKENRDVKHTGILNGLGWLRSGGIGYDGVCETTDVFEMSEVSEVSEFIRFARDAKKGGSSAGGKGGRGRAGREDSEQASKGQGEMRFKGNKKRSGEGDESKRGDGGDDNSDGDDNDDRKKRNRSDRGDGIVEQRDGGDCLSDELMEDFVTSMPKGACVVEVQVKDPSPFGVVAGFTVLCLITCAWMFSVFTSAAMVIAPLTGMLNVGLVLAVGVMIPHALEWLRFWEVRRGRDNDAVRDVWRKVMSWSHGWMKRGSALIFEDLEAIRQAGQPNTPTDITQTDSTALASASSSSNSSSPTTRNKPTLVCVHPHGVFCVGFHLICVSPIFAKFRILVAAFVYYFAFLLRFMTDPVLACWPAGREKMREAMGARANLLMLPGGFHEASCHEYGVDRVFLEKRKGFVKYAMQYGYSLTPAYIFGECHTYHQPAGWWSLRFWLSDRSIPGVLFWGEKWMPFMPKRVPLSVVIGRPIDVPHIENPTQQQIDEAHTKYVNGLVDLYNKFKFVYCFHHNRDDLRERTNGCDRQLEVW
eukprot:GHVN01103138.1.p1 GENE.GHVN01103138.1~~GHVN01103138.1.p1  ORF type:complete len:803 (+),score=216.05 GHVN01103138.1:191-2410(+)